MFTSNVDNGLLLSSSADCFILQSEFENNGANGIEISNTSATRIYNSDVGGNGSTSGKGIYIHGTKSGNGSNVTQITNTQFGNNYAEDVYIVGYDTTGGGYSAIHQLITGCIFNGSSNRPASTYYAINMVDGYQNVIVGNFFNATNTLGAITCSESSSGRSYPSVIVGNAVNESLNTIIDSSLANRNLYSDNNQYESGYLRDTQAALTANYNSGSAKTIYEGINGTDTILAVKGVQAINRSATSSSTFPSLTLSWTDPGGISRTQTLVATSTGNATSVITSFVTAIHVKAGTAVTLTSASYASSGATSMQYSLGYTVKREYN